MAYTDLLNKAKNNRKAYRQILKKGLKLKPWNQLQSFHKEAFNKIDCLACARCCKGYSPRFNTTDIKRISKYLGMKEGSFIDGYLEIDEDDDFVLRKKPCSFLGEDNRCSIYEVRPQDCRRYPYTNEDILLKKSALSMKNLEICPAVSVVLDMMEERILK
jgi:Fe-S-cluster containining protein